MTKTKYSWGPTPTVQVPYLTAKIQSFLKARRQHQIEESSGKKRGTETVMARYWKSLQTEMDVLWPTFAAEEEAEAAALLEKKKEQEAAAAAKNDEASSAPAKGATKKGKRARKPAAAPTPVRREEPPATMTLEQWRAHRKEKALRWFYNRTSTSRKSRPKIEIIVAPMGGKLPCDYQMYSRLFYEDRIKKEVEKEIKAKTEAGVEFSAVALRQEVTKRLWEAEDEDIKSEVEAELELFAANRKKAAEGLIHALDEVLDAQRTPGEYNDFLQILPDVLHAFFSVIAAKTGWTFSLLAGGPDPANVKEKGGIRTLSYHAGRSSQGQNFSQYLGDEWRDKFMRPFSGWAHLMFPKEIRQARALTSQDSSSLDMLLALNPDFVDEDQPVGTPPLPPAPSLDDAGTATEPGKESASVSPETGGEVENEKSKGAAKKGKKGGQNRKKATKTAAAGDPGSAGVPLAGASGVAAGASGEGPSTSGVRGGESPRGQEGAQEGNEGHSQSEGARDAEGPKKGGSGTTGGSADEPPLPNLPPKPSEGFEGIHDLMLEEPATFEDFESAHEFEESPNEDVETLLKSTDPATVSYDPSANAPPAGSLALQAVDAGLVNHRDGSEFHAIMTRVDESFAEDGNLGRTLAVGTENLGEGQLARVDSQAGQRTKRIRDPVAEEEQQPRAKRSCRLNPRLETPSWVYAALRYLQADLKDKEWTRCLELWVKFETHCAVSDGGPVRLPGASSRPKVLTNYIQRRKWNDDVDIGNLNQWAKVWLAWWTGIQPAWRKKEKAGLPNSALGGKDLSLLKKPGPNGLFSVLVSLKWWAKAKTPPVQWKEAVEDLANCFSVLSDQT